MFDERNCSTTTSIACSIDTGVDLVSGVIEEAAIEAAVGVDVAWFCLLGSIVVAEATFTEAATGVAGALVVAIGFMASEVGCDGLNVVCFGSLASAFV